MLKHVKTCQNMLKHVTTRKPARGKGMKSHQCRCTTARNGDTASQPNRYDIDFESCSFYWYFSEPPDKTGGYWGVPFLASSNAASLGFDRVAKESHLMYRPPILLGFCRLFLVKVGIVFFCAKSKNFLAAVLRSRG